MTKNDRTFPDDPFPEQGHIKNGSADFTLPESGYYPYSFPTTKTHTPGHPRRRAVGPSTSWLAPISSTAPEPTTSTSFAPSRRSSARCGPAGDVVIVVQPSKPHSRQYGFLETFTHRKFLRCVSFSFSSNVLSCSGAPGAGSSVGFCK